MHHSSLLDFESFLWNRKQWVLFWRNVKSFFFVWWCLSKLQFLYCRMDQLEPRLLIWPLLWKLGQGPLPAWQVIMHLPMHTISDLSSPLLFNLPMKAIYLKMLLQWLVNMCVVWWLLFREFPWLLLHWTILVPTLLPSSLLVLLRQSLLHSGFLTAIGTNFSIIIVFCYLNHVLYHIF